MQRRDNTICWFVKQKSPTNLAPLPTTTTTSITTSTTTNERMLILETLTAKISPTTIIGKAKAKGYNNTQTIPVEEED